MKFYVSLLALMLAGLAQADDEIGLGTAPDVSCVVETLNNISSDPQYAEYLQFNTKKVSPSWINFLLAGDQIYREENGFGSVAAHSEITPVRARARSRSLERLIQRIQMYGFCDEDAFVSVDATQTVKVETGFMVKTPHQLTAGEWVSHTRSGEWKDKCELIKNPREMKEAYRLANQEIFGLNKKGFEALFNNDISLGEEKAALNEDLAEKFNQVLMKPDEYLLKSKSKLSPLTSKNMKSCLDQIKSRKSHPLFNYKSEQNTALCHLMVGTCNLRNSEGKYSPVCNRPPAVKKGEVPEEKPVAQKPAPIPTGGPSIGSSGGRAGTPLPGGSGKYSIPKEKFDPFKKPPKHPWQEPSPQDRGGVPAVGGTRK